MRKWKLKKIDWSNHTIGFVSTIIGILIAFQLEEWRENHDEQARIDKAELSLVTELQRNKAGLENVVKENHDWLAYANFMFAHLRNDKLACTQQELDSISKVYPERFDNVTFLRKLNRTENLYNFSFEVDRHFIFQIETDAWAAAKSSGILNFMEQENVFWYVKTYKELERKLNDLTEQTMMDKLSESDSHIALYNLIETQTKVYEVKLHYTKQGLHELQLLHEK